MEDQTILELKNISKSFSGVTVLKNITVSLNKGEVRGLVGENGAGKSTLNKIICGVYKNDTGAVIFKGKILPKGNPIAVKESKIFMIPQDLGLMENLSVMQNILLGREFSKFGFINLKKSRDLCKKILDDIEIKLDLDAIVSDLTIDQRQFVAIARVLSANADLIIMDEPSSTLSKGEVKNLLNIIKNLKKKNITIIYVSHKIDEIFEIADSITILKDGNLIETVSIENITKDEVINKMVGRQLSNVFPPRKESKQIEKIMSLTNVNVKGHLIDINFDINKGEILGIGGLVGMGQSSLLNTIFGILKVNSGRIFFKNKPLKNIKPAYSIKKGIYYISSDRSNEMLFMCRSVKENISIATLKDYKKLFSINTILENKIIDKKIKEFNIAAFNREQESRFLSGGNQQKTILARWLIHKPEIFLLDEPTQGIDVGTKQDIYNTLRNLANEGMAIVVVLSDMIELLGLCDRVLVMYEGSISKIFTSQEATEEKIMLAASGK
ncbi:MAG TPA: D-xylose ABC transporter ATP-binding protein [Clostridiales bacterium]|nr:D-xylose ABC transporter ATP-binding protein [Clostridiales bacterium]